MISELENIEKSKESLSNKKSSEIKIEDKDKYLNKIKKLFADKLAVAGSKVAIFTHPSPDPDAIASQMALSWLLHKQFEAEVECFYDGHISHPQNMAMVNLLDPVLLNLDTYNPQVEYKLKILVDTVPAHAALPQQDIDLDLVIDHHKEIPNGGFKGVFYNLKAGSCCGTIYHIIKSYQQGFDDNNDLDKKVATGLLVGIATDTENLLSEDTGPLEFSAYSELFDYRNQKSLMQIMCYKRPKSWIDAKALIAGKVEIDGDGIAIVGVGFLNNKQRDLIADISDEMMTWANVETAISFAIIDGDRIEGSVRSSNASISVPGLCKELAGRTGQGGGKLGKGAYHYGTGGIRIDEDADEMTKNKMWEFMQNYEIDRVLGIVKK